jgi:phosphoenolpyruvate-protein kinase (PTS system EI component)
VPAIKRQIRSLKIDDCRDLAARCLELASAAQVRAAVAREIGPAGETP